MGDITVGVCYRLLDQEEIDEAFYIQLKVVSCSQALVLMGHLNHPDICWKNNTVRHKQSRRFLESTDDKISDTGDGETSECALLDLVLKNEEVLFGDVKPGVSPGYSDHEII